jgi:ferrochelatase
MIQKTAVLLVNLGTPTDISNKAIKSYLREFLLDYRVINLPWILRYLLVNTVIVPFRSKTSLHAYKSIWTENGSPLLINSRNLQQKLRLQLNPETPQSKQEPQFDVWLAMRYGSPKLPDVLTKLQHNNYSRIIIVPLYPQYASASNGSVLEKSLKHLSEFRYFPKIICLNEFYTDIGYIKSMARLIKTHINNNKTIEHKDANKSHLLFSYHGIPKNQLKLSKNSATVCEDNNPCPAINFPNKCYRAQCYATSNAIAQELNLNPDQYSTGFQSRLGKLPWIRPYTDELIINLHNKGITTLNVVCPSFVADCLETLEEIGIRLKQEWLKIGGKEFNLIPCLNDDNDWINALAHLIVTA